MGKMSETELKRLIQGGETNTIELKVAAPRATEMASIRWDSGQYQPAQVGRPPVQHH
jgi:hypothetical protein